MAELEIIVRKLECLGPGLYVAQYEQLNIDNQNYLTKIEGEIIKNKDQIRWACVDYTLRENRADKQSWFKLCKDKF